jgi:hypothetical protein
VVLHAAVRALCAQAQNGYDSPLGRAIDAGAKAETDLVASGRSL